VPRADLRRGVWIKPELVCEIEFTERTADGELRHPSFKGFRADKPAREVRLETTEPPPPAPAKPAKRSAPASPRRR
jgi:bifunctional non-homologous end joining protein LigD